MTGGAPRESDPPKRSVARLAFGHGHEVAGVVYGTIIAMATLTASYANIKDAWELAAIVWSTLFVLWIAHVYAHGLAESMARGRRLDRLELKSLSRRELGILLSAAGPSLALLLGALDVLKLGTSVWLALGIGLGILGIEGLRYARLEKLSMAGTLAVTAANVALGVLVVALKIGVTH
jgi:hypothetical protein